MITDIRVTDPGSSRANMGKPHLFVFVSTTTYEWTFMTDPALFGRSADYYASIGWQIFPCHGVTDGGMCTCGRTHDDPKDKAKHPTIKGWNVEATSDRSQIEMWWNANPEYNVSVFCQKSGFFVIDIDPRSGGFESFEEFERLVEGALPPTVEAITGTYSHKGREVRGRHLYYKADKAEKFVMNLKEAKLPGIDIKHNGYVLVAPSRHISGVSYEWKPGHAPWEIDMAEAPEELLESLRSRNGRRSRTSMGESDWGFLGDLEFKGEKFDIDKIMAEGVDEGSRAITLYAMACALANTVDVGTEAGRMMVETTMIRFNAEKVSPPLELEGPGGLLSHVRNAVDFVRNNPKTGLLAEIKDWHVEAARKVSAGTFRASTPAVSAPSPEYASTSDPDDTIYNLPGTIGGAVSRAAMSGMSHRDASSLRVSESPPDRDALTAEEGGDPNKRSLTDVGNGRRLVDAYGSVIRYTPGLGWFNWSGTHWENDPENLSIRELSKQMASNILSEVVEYEDKDRPEVVKWSVNAKSSARLDASIKNANSDPRIAVSVDDWDSNQYLLGVTNGVVDLRTGELLRGRPDLHITRRTPVAYTPGLQSDRWNKFLDFATGGDKEYQEWLQRAVGYTITGMSTLDLMFLVYGKPGSGKNTFVETVVKCLGTKQYAWPMDSTILAQNDGQSSSTDLYHWAELRGRRMVWVDELPDGERIKENAVKKLTGSSEISARSPGEKPFTFQSQAKLWITTNHRPIITDDAMWRRIRPIPWMHVPAEADPSLKEFLFNPEGGLPAVLSWAVEGAIKFLSAPETDGLGWCKIVYEAAEMYRKSEDRLGMFMMAELEQVAGGAVPIKSVYGIYRLWSEGRGEKPLSQIRLIRMLRDRGYEVTGESGNDDLMGYTHKARSYTASPVLDWDVLGRFAQ